MAEPGDDENGDELRLETLFVVPYQADGDPSRIPLPREIAGPALVDDDRRARYRERPRGLFCDPEETFSANRQFFG